VSPEPGASPPSARGRRTRTLFSARALFLLSGLFIFYATTIPWDFARPPSMDRVSWLPLWDSVRGRPASLPDLLQNVLLFLPFGYFGVLAIASVRRRGAVAGTLLVGLIGLSLSLLVESLQTMSLERSPSVSDLSTNFAGALAGGAAGFAYLRRVQEPLDAWIGRMVRERPGLLLCLAATIALSLGALAPFVPSLDVSHLRANLRLLIDHPWGPRPLGGMVKSALGFGALSFLLVPEVSWSEARGESIPRALAVLIAVAATTLLAVALEVGQIVVVGHSPGISDGVAGVGGAVLGALIAGLSAREPLRPARELGELCTRAPALAIGFAILTPAVRALAPFEWVAPAEKLAGFSLWQLVPFWATFRHITIGTLVSVVAAALAYVPLGYTLTALGRRHAAAFALAFGLALVLEVLQIGVVGRTFDVTEGIFGGAGALTGAWAFERLRRGRVGATPA